MLPIQHGIELTNRLALVRQRVRTARCHRRGAVAQAQQVRTVVTHYECIISAEACKQGLGCISSRGWLRGCSHGADPEPVRS